MWRNRVFPSPRQIVVRIGKSETLMAAKSKAQTTARAKSASRTAKKPAARAASAKSVKSTSKKPVKKVAAKVTRAAKATSKTAKAKAAAPKKAAVKKTAAVTSKKTAATVKKVVAKATESAAKKTVAKAAVAAKAVVAAKAKAAAPARAVAASKASASRLSAPAKAAAKPAAPKKPVNQRHGFKTNEYIVYPAHGVGRIIGIEEQEIAGMALELFVIHFEKEKLTLRVPTGKLESVGMRKLAEDGLVKKAMDTLKGRARVKRTMWSRRAQEYIAKINSGDLISIAEVVRDLYRSDAQPEQSYSGRQLYEDALDRMARELAAVERLDERGAVQRITEVLSKSAKGRRAAEEEAEEAEAA